MAARSNSQRIGSAAQRLVELLIEKSNTWLSRRQDEDFGIDLEAEIAEPSVSGQIIKVQVKGTEMPEIGAEGVKLVLETKYLRLAESLRIPLILVLADTSSDRAWFVWLQGWVVEQRRAGKPMETLGETVTLYIPEADTLTAGLRGPLIQVARWEHENQMIIALTDTLRTAVSTRNQNVLLAVSDMIAALEGAYQSFAVEHIIDAAVEMNAKPRWAWETSILGHFLGLVGRKHGKKLSKHNVLRMVIHGDGWSRAGLVGLGALYDEHGEHLRAMRLPDAFDQAGFIKIGFYCRLREKYPDVKAMQLAFGNYDYSIGGFAVEIEDKNR